MTEEQRNLLNTVAADFEILWDGLGKIIPVLNQLISKKELRNLKKKYIAKLEALFDSGQKQITTSCLFDEYISSCCKGPQSKEFIDEINCIATTIRKAIDNANLRSKKEIQNNITTIVKELLITMDKDPSSKNPDYRNRFHELLVFNMLMDCDNVEVTNIAYKLDNGKDCDFRCIHKEGTELLIEVVSIHNIDLNKQDDALSFSEFINKKIQNKYNDKTKGLTHIDKFHILPILEYDERIGDFGPTLNPSISLPAYTVTKNISGERIEPILIQIEGIQNLFNKEN